MYSQGKTGSSVGDCTPFLLPADELAAELHRLIRREEELLEALLIRGTSLRLASAGACAAGWLPGTRASARALLHSWGTGFALEGVEDDEA